MKKSIALLAGLALSCSAVGMNAFAAEDTAESGVLKQNVLVTISDGKDLVLPQADVLAEDLDGNNKIDVNEALVAAHEKFFDGGAEAGYKASEKEGYDGLSLDKLWGVENGGSYGFYVNSKMAWSLNDEVKENDLIDAYVYSDTKTYSDTYCFFDIRESLDNEEGDSLDLTLSKVTFDTNYNPVNVPVEGAMITIDGTGTGVLTDADGKATITLTNDSDSSKKAVISAVSESENLVPPVCLAVINKKEETTTTETETTTSSATTTNTVSTELSETSTSSATSTAAAANSDSPKTGDAGTGSVAAVLGCTVLAAFALRRKDV